MKKQDEGFTLIELLIVIVILGILAAVVVFAVGGITDRGEESACEAEKKTLEVAMEAYYAQESDYPTTVTQIASYTRETPTLYDISGTNGDLTNSGDQCSGI